MNKTHQLLLAASVALASCGNSITTEDHGQYILVHQTDGPTLGYSPASGVKILEVEGKAFKDLNRNDTLDLYEDWRATPDDRARDLAARLSIDEISGLMLYSMHQAIPSTVTPGRFEECSYNGTTLEESGLKSSDMTDQQRKFLKEDHVRAVLVTTVESPEVAAQWNNNVQAYVEGMGHGIPANNSSDPRNEATATAEYNFGAGGDISIWPLSLGIAATFDPEVMKEFGRIASREYRALGITTALSPQVDLATDPRWTRFNGTFGDDSRLATDMARAYCDGFQTSPKDNAIAGAWGYESVNAMVKHWYGYGAQEGGRDSHFCFGKYAVYPGNNLKEHLLTFTEGAFSLEDGTAMASAVMPTYSILWNQDPSGEHVGAGFSKWMVQDVLRGECKFDGVVCTDWGIMYDNRIIERRNCEPWGTETMTMDDRHFKILEAGVDQFGGQNNRAPVMAAYNKWVEKYGRESADERFRLSAYRLLKNYFRVGLFENPYLDIEQTKATVGCPEYMQAGYDAQLKSVVLLKNLATTLPVKDRKKVFVPKRHTVPLPGFFGLTGDDKWDYPISLDLVKKYFDVVDSAEAADFALVMIEEPNAGAGYSADDQKAGGNGYMPISLQYGEYTATEARATSIAGGDPKENFTNRSYKGKTVKAYNYDDLLLVTDTKRAMGSKPVVLVVNIGRPFVPSEIEPSADALLITFHVCQQAVLDIISGKHEPSALLPMDMPRDMQVVETQMEDVSHDFECYTDAEQHTYRFGYGMNFEGVIHDARVEKYAKK